MPKIPKSYLAGDSYFHRCDARAKLLGALSLLIAIFVTNNSLVLLSLAALLIASVTASRLSFKAYLASLVPYLVIIGASSVLNLLFMATNPTLGQVIELGEISISLGGVTSALHLGLRLVLSLMVISLCAATSSSLALSDAFKWLTRPFARFGFPLDDAAIVMGITLSFIPTLARHFHQIYQAQLSRGSDFKRTWIHSSFTSLIATLNPLMRTSLRTAEALSLSMDARGFCSQAKRGSLHVNHFSKTDIVLIAISISVALISCALRLAG